MRLRASTAAAVVLAAASVTAQSGERPASPAGPDAAFRDGVELVALAVTVESGDGRPAMSLARGDFQVFEEGTAQDIAFFEAAGNPIDLVVMIDASASMTGRLPVARHAAAELIRSLGTGDRVALMTVDRPLRTFVPFTGDRQVIRHALNGISPSGNTALYDAMYLAFRSFASLDGRAGVRRRAIVVLTDGADTSSLIGFDDILGTARRASVAVYPISLSHLAGHTPIEREIAAAYELRLLAAETGARAFFPERPEDLDGVYESIAREISQQYVLGYVPGHYPLRAGFRSVSVIVGAPGVTVRARKGYIVDK